ncbi:hypothetical protein GXW76_05355, partial [Roseomonas soli]|nr:hypothetical protein [Neoroseomonas soli]
MTDSPDYRLARRLLVVRLATAGGTAALPGAALAQGVKGEGGGTPAPAPAPSPAPVPPRNAPSGVSDTDPGDPAGQGRGGGRPPVKGGQQRQQQSGLTDADPGDPPNNGRGPQGGGRPMGPTDADPGDP